MIGIKLLQAADGLIVAYILLLTLRVFLSWFRASLYGRPWLLLQRVTDPYLGLFRRIPLLRMGAFDLSPIVAVLVLLVLHGLVSQLIWAGTITLGFVLGALASALWDGVSGLLLFFALFCVFRLVGFGLRSARNPSLWQALDTMVQPLVGWFTRRLGLFGRLSYVQTIALTAAILLTLWFLGGMGVRVLVRALKGLPI